MSTPNADYVAALRVTAQSILAGIQRLEELDDAKNVDPSWADVTAAALSAADGEVWGLVDWCEAATQIDGYGVTT